VQHMDLVSLFFFPNSTPSCSSNKSSSYTN
jgi:hypothetical protein